VIIEDLTESNGSWVARLIYREGGERRERRRTLGRADAISRREALLRLAEARRELEADLARAPRHQEVRADMTFRSIALAWLDDAGRAAGRAWKPSTARSYRSILGQSRTRSTGHIMEPLALLRLDELTEIRMRYWWASLDELSAHTANKHLSVVRAIFAWAARDGRWGPIEDPTRRLRRRQVDAAAERAPPRDAPVLEADAPTRRERRPRERATLVVVLLGVPLLVVFAVARILPDALWFDELGELGVFARVQFARVALFILAGGAAGLLLWLNLAFVLPRVDLPRNRVAPSVAAAASLITASYFASSAARHWQTFLLWSHRQSFGVKDPMFGKDVGYFVFSLPFERAVSGFLLWLVAVAALYVAFAYHAGGALSVRPVRASAEARRHLLALAAVFLLVVAWRLRLERYMLELGQPSPRDSGSIAGAGYVDAHVRSSFLAAGSLLAVVVAVACLAAPRYARLNRRRAKLLVVVNAALVLVVAVGGPVAAPLVQRFVVEPSQLSREAPFLKRSIVATRAALGLDAIDVQPYAPAGRLTPTDVSRARNRLADVQVWDTSLLHARARQLVTDAPYFSPERPIYDISRINGRRQLTIAGPRELDLRPVRAAARDWGNERLAYTHGLGEVRFSGTDIEPNRQPRLLDAGLGLAQPRIYFGAFPKSPWVVANTRRGEVDVPAADGGVTRAYHYDGTGGVALSSWIRRAVFALQHGSRELLLSHAITPQSRILMHRDVRDRLRTLAPFIQWDQHPVPLTLNGRIVFLVDGYTTSNDYPYAQRVALGGARVSYARASVSATVDAFSGKVKLYLTDRSDPLARAWAAAFPSLFRRQDEMPAGLRERQRYPRTLFEAQASAYERFHTKQPDRFASGADAWSRPIALAGSIEVAGDVDFDESDEDDLRLTMRPGYLLSPPPGGSRSRLLIETYYGPRRGQNLVATLTGWIDGHGRARLAARSLPRARVTPGPAQVSRQVFATPRVSRLLGLSNLEIRDLEKSSLDSVVLGQPHLLFLPGGTAQIQSLYEGSRGPGAARLIGVTAFLNGRAGLGPDIQGAVRQALHQAPKVKLLRPHGPISVGTPVELELASTHARRAVVTIRSPGGTQRTSVGLRTGRGTLTWVPSKAGHADVRVEAEGLDGSRVAARGAFRVLSRPPAVRLTRPPRRAVVGRPVRVLFRVTHGVGAVVEVASRSGVEFTRRYVIRGGTGVIEWTPKTAGRAVLRIRATGRERQAATDLARISVARAPRVATPPTVTLLETPRVARVGGTYEIVFGASRCREAVVRVNGTGEGHSVWRFRCADRPLKFHWSPTRPGRHLVTVGARGPRGAAAQTVLPLNVEGRP
jgi:uncharacterized membrane protein (UPF0182 family)